MLVIDIHGLSKERDPLENWLVDPSSQKSMRQSFFVCGVESSVLALHPLTVRPVHICSYLARLLQVALPVGLSRFYLGVKQSHPSLSSGKHPNF